jgi:hypothetical protein
MLILFMDDGGLDRNASVIRVVMIGVRTWPGYIGRVTLHRSPLRAMEGRRVGRALSQPMGMVNM